ncbi:MAG: type III-B CRISPR module-associated protein Cmr5 [Burkholderiales bacterium]|nr:type III-B CRISPR module-associated protein Cmr5 [Burkholderiales bacterium]
MQQTLDQRIAHLTHEAYEHLKSQVPGKELPGYIKKTATRLRVSGLGVTVAFCLKDQQLASIAHHVATVLHRLGLPHVRENHAESLLSAYRQASAIEVRRLQVYAEQVLEWLAKWADTYKQ